MNDDRARLAGIADRGAGGLLAKGCGGLKILIVDDDPSVRVMMKLVFETAGFEVVEAHHGAAALDLLKDLLPSLVVTDMMMPVMDGKDLIRHLRSNPALAALPIVVVSGNPDALEAGRMADAVVGKPFIPASLVETVNGLLARQAQ